MRWTNDAYEIDDDRSRLDMERIVAWLAESYWAGTQPEAAVRRSWDVAGVALGLYHGGQMIGCARAITDFTRFAYLSDVYVEPEHRGQGLGRWLVQTMLDHPDVPRVRWVLHTSDATARRTRSACRRARSRCCASWWPARPTARSPRSSSSARGPLQARRRHPRQARRLLPR